MVLIKVEATNQRAGYITNLTWFQIVTFSRILVKKQRLQSHPRDVQIPKTVRDSLGRKDRDIQLKSPGIF